jgi:hypothetical protein
MNTVLTLAELTLADISAIITIAARSNRELARSL